MLLTRVGLDEDILGGWWSRACAGEQKQGASGKQPVQPQRPDSPLFHLSAQVRISCEAVSLPFPGLAGFLVVELWKGLPSSLQRSARSTSSSPPRDVELRLPALAKQLPRLIFLPCSTIEYSAED